MDHEQFYWSMVAEEYKTLRDESKQASINMYSAMQWGATFVGVAMAAGFSQWGKSAGVIAAVFLLLVPLLSAIAMVLWLGEAIRFKRVGDYISMLEQKFGLLFDASADQHPLNTEWSLIQRELEKRLNLVESPLLLYDPLGWEQWLRNTRRERKGSLILETSGHQTLIYLLRLAFFPLVMIFSYVIGADYVRSHPPAPRAIIGTDFISRMLANLDFLATAELIGATIIGVSCLLASIVAWKLSRKAQPFDRTAFLLSISTTGGRRRIEG